MYDDARVSASQPSSRPTRTYNMGASLRVEQHYDAVLRRMFEPVFDILDYRDSKLSKEERERARRRKVDIALGRNGMYVDVDDKACRRVADTGNLALEAFTLSRQGLTPGWMFAGEMAWVRYGSCYSPDIFFIPMYQAKDWLWSGWRRFDSASAKNAAGGSKRFTHITYSLLVPVPVLLEEVPDAFHVLVPSQIQEFSRPSVVRTGHPKTVELESTVALLLASAQRWTRNPPISTEFVLDVIAGARSFAGDLTELAMCALPCGVDVARLEQRHRELAQHSVH